MSFEWDENKREKNIDRHHLDFIDVPIVLEGPLIVGSAKTVDAECRLLATGMLDDIHVTVIYTVRGEVIRVISFRRARRNERKRYQELHGS